MIAAIYARKSTDQSGVADEQKSVTRQIEHAKAYARRNGWSVAEEHIYVDDGISGAEFSSRPGYMRLLNALKPRAPFTLLIVSELSRLGREQLETGYTLKQLDQAGVRVVSYLENREIRLDTPTDKFLMSAVSFAAEIEREKTRQRVTDAMSRRARAGHSCGGSCFGYDNIPVVDASGRRSHVERRINQTEATIVRWIFDLCAVGMGYTRIAKLLNAEGAPTPRPKLGRPNAWAPSSVKEVLDRRLYLGEVTWNRSKKTDAWGQKRQRPRPDHEWIQRSMPELRIVTDAQWDAARSRLDRIRQQLIETSGGTLGRRRWAEESDYLLAGFARCAICGGSLGVMGGSHRASTHRTRPPAYGCVTYHKRGPTVCENRLKLPVSRVDEAVLARLAGDVLQPAFVLAVVDGLVEAYASSRQSERADRLRAELDTVTREIGNLTRAIAAAGALESLLAELKARERRRDELSATIAAHEAVDLRSFDRRQAERLAEEYLSRWRGLLTKHVGDARQALREALVGPLQFTPDEGVYRFEGEVALGELVAGVVGLPTNLVAVRGFEPRSRG